MAKKKDPTVQEFDKTVEKVRSEVPDNRVKIREPDDREPYQEPEKPEKGEQPEPEPKKNNLARIPNTVELAYDAPAKSEQDLDSDDPAHVMAQQLESGELDPTDLSTDDKMLVIAHLTEDKNLKADLVAEKLQMSRRSIVKYLKRLREHRAKELADKDIWELGGELYTMAMTALRQALEDRKPQQFSYVMQTMVNTLQSMGLVFRMPTQSQHQLQAMHHISSNGSQGLADLQKQLQGQEVNFQNVLESMLSAAEQGQLEKAEDDGQEKEERNNDN